MSVVSWVTFWSYARGASRTCNGKKYSTLARWNSWELQIFFLWLLVFVANMLCWLCVWLCLSVWMWILLQVPAPHVRRTLVPTWVSASSSGRTTPATAPWPPTLAHSAMTVSHLALPVISASGVHTRSKPLQFTFKGLFKATIYLEKSWNMAKPNVSKV